MANKRGAQNSAPQPTSNQPIIFLWVVSKSQIQALTRISIQYKTKYLFRSPLAQMRLPQEGPLNISSITRLRLDLTIIVDLNSR